MLVKMWSDHNSHILLVGMKDGKPLWKLLKKSELLKNYLNFGNYLKKSTMLL